MNGKDYIRNAGYFISRIAESSGLSCSTVNEEVGLAGSFFSAPDMIGL